MTSRPWKTALLLLAASSVLTGCFPLIVGGVAGTAVVASDRRTTGTVLDDQTLELKASDKLNKIPNAHINITSFNRAVLLTGEVPSDEMEKQVVLTVMALPGVTRVENYLIVKEPSSLSERSNDTWITSKVRGQLGVNGAIKVVTERGVVYLKGLVTRDEGAAAAAVASKTSGVQKVVTLFEYLNPVPSVSTGASAAK